MSLCGFVICGPYLFVICGLKTFSNTHFSPTNLVYNLFNSNLYIIKNRLKGRLLGPIETGVVQFFVVIWGFAICGSIKKFADLRFADLKKVC